MADEDDISQYIVSEKTGISASYSGSNIRINLPESVTSAFKKARTNTKQVGSVSQDYKKSIIESLSRNLERAREQRLSTENQDLTNAISSTPEETSDLEQKLDTEFTSDTVSYQEYKGERAEYRGSLDQQSKYQKLLESDQRFKDYIIKTYGSFENFKIQKNLRFSASVYNPLVDYPVSCTVITDRNTIYTTDHISTGELLMEAIDGICTFHYIKVDGSSGKSTGTLSSKYVPDSQDDYRTSFFTPLRGDRIIIWDIYKQKWNSFYMSRLWKFTRDDTTELE
jgi:hypothetical protein